MKNLISQVNDYFKGKMLSSEFETVQMDEYTMEIVIDDEYHFTLWIGNLELPETLKCYGNKLSFMDIQFSPEEKIAFNKAISPEILRYKKQELYYQKKAELEVLERELSTFA